MLVKGTCQRKQPWALQHFLIHSWLRGSPSSLDGPDYVAGKL